MHYHGSSASSFMVACTGSSHLLLRPHGRVRRPHPTLPHFEAKLPTMQGLVIRSGPRQRRECDGHKPGLGDSRLPSRGAGPHLGRSGTGRASAPHALNHQLHNPGFGRATRETGGENLSPGRRGRRPTRRSPCGQTHCAGDASLVQLAATWAQGAHPSWAEGARLVALLATHAISKLQAWVRSGCRPGMA